MLLEITGIGQRRSGVSKAGKDYDGKSVYGLTAARDVEGKKAEEIYFNFQSGFAYPDVKIGDTIDVRYDKNGYITDITIAKKS